MEGRRGDIPHTGFRFSPPEVEGGSSKAASWLSLKAFTARMRFCWWELFAGQKKSFANECLHSECEHHSVKSDTFIFWIELKFSELFPETSPDHVSPAAATSTTMADKLLISVSQHQTRSDK